MYIRKSVGRGGQNNSADVKFVQELLNVLGDEDARFPCLEVDGKYGDKTKKAIGIFQQHYVKLRTLDYRIDPNGRSEKTLISKIIEIDNCLVASVAKDHGLTKDKPSISGSGSRLIHYRTNAKRVLSAYSENIVKLAMGYAGINRCDISSTIRTVDDQVRIMYGNCSNFPNANSVTALRAARGWGYAEAGRSVEQVYYDTKASGEAKTKKAMKEKIEALAKQDKRVSLHCVPESVYKKNNILDIPYSSVVGNKHKAFELALMGMTATGKVKNARYGHPIQGEVYISQLIIEDKCWHIEIAQKNKKLPNQNPPPAPAIKRKVPKKNRVSDSYVARNNFFSFLDDWF